MPGQRYTWTDPVLCHYDFDLSKNWFVYFDITDSLTGDKQRKQFRGGINFYKKKNERIAEGNALASFWREQLQCGWNPFHKSAPVQKKNILDAVNYLCSIKADTLKKRTKETYVYRQKIFVEWLTVNRLSNLPVERFNVEMANAFTDWLIAEKKFQNRTYNDFKTFLSGLFNEMIRREMLSKNPFANIKTKPVAIGRNIAFDDAELLQLKELLYRHDRELYYFTQFMYYCFIRRTELTHLRVRNIDFENMTITIPLDDNSEGAKNNIQESVVMPKGFLSIINEMQLHKLPGGWFVFGRGVMPGPYQYRQPNHISARHKSFLDKHFSGIDKDKGLYSWKHSGVCKAYEKTKDIFAIMRQCRHSDISTTQIYLKSLGLIDNAAIRNAVW